MPSDISYVAIGGAPDHAGVLPPNAVAAWSRLASALASGWSDKTQRPRLERIAGCLDKLAAALLQVARLRAHHDELARKAAVEPSTCPSSLAFRGIEVLVDFEGLLLHGRAALDRLTWFASSDLGVSSKTQSFRKLRAVARQHARRRPSAASIERIVDQALPDLGVAFAKGDSLEALRDLIGHRHALSEGVRTCLSIVWPEPRLAFMFDCEVQLPHGGGPVALLACARQAGQTLPFTVLNCLAALMDLPLVDLETFAPQWPLKAIARSAFSSKPEPSVGSAAYVLPIANRMTPDGFEVSLTRFGPDIRQHAVTSA